MWTGFYNKRLIKQAHGQVHKELDIAKQTCVKWVLKAPASILRNDILKRVWGLSNVFFCDCERHSNYHETRFFVGIDRDK